MGRYTDIGASMTILGRTCCWVSNTHFNILKCDAGRITYFVSRCT